MGNIYPHPIFIRKIVLDISYEASPSMESPNFFNRQTGWNVKTIIKGKKYIKKYIKLSYANVWIQCIKQYSEVCYWSHNEIFFLTFSLEYGFAIKSSYFEESLVMSQLVK